jgi:formylglycine-generating enzyme required for sulfatase activity
LAVAPTADHSPLTTHHSPVRYYQLTHDDLVPSLRAWLTRKQRETRRGRAELRLAERAALWEARPENRRLPSALEWANIRLLTRPRDWTAPQRRMMRAVARYYATRGAAVVVVAALAGWWAFESLGTFRARSMVDALRSIETKEVPRTTADLDGLRRWADPMLRRMLRGATEDSRERLHASLALLPVDDSQVAYLSGRLVASPPGRTLPPGDLPVIRSALAPHRAELTPGLWGALEAAEPGAPGLLPAAAALAVYDPDDPRWRDLGGKVARALVTVNPALLGPWLDALRPVRDRLAEPLDAIFRDRSRPETETAMATGILADYAADEPTRLADLLMDAQPKSFRTLFDVARRSAEAVLPVLEAELEKEATFDWNDRPLARDWTTPATAVVRRIEAAGGLIAERFAACQSMPLDEFPATAEALRPSGYRPVRFRPYADVPAVRVAALWTRDGRAWRLGSGLTPEEVRRGDEADRREGFRPVDVAGYVAKGGDGKPAERYAALWVEADDEARLHVGASDDDLADVQAPLQGAQLIPRTLQVFRSPEGGLRYSGVWGRPPSVGVTSQADRDLFRWDFAEALALRSQRVLVDVAVSEAGAPRPLAERARAALERAGQALRAHPDDRGARMSQARARLRLGEDGRALDDLNAILARDREDLEALRLRALAQARLGKRGPALADLARYRRESPDATGLGLAAVVAAELGDGVSGAIRDLEAALRREPGDADLRLAAAAAFARVSEAVGRADREAGRRLAGRSLDLLREAVRDEVASFGLLDDSLDFDPLRADPAFASLLASGHPERRYAAVRSSEARVDAAVLDGLDPAEHQGQARELAARGYRPVAWSVARTAAEGPPLSASVWYRPRVAPQSRDRLAARQARAAVAMLRLGEAESVWRRLRHGTDPRLRSLLVNWLGPLGADPARIADALLRPDPPANGPSPPASGMDAILFDPEASRRRALILAMGTYGAESLPEDDRGRIVARLLELYRDDPDAGVHGAAARTLCRWGRRERVVAIDAELGRLKSLGGRRWYVNGQGQTFAVVAGPVEFRKGAPADEPGREGDDQPLRRMVVPRRFAIAATEVTVGQSRKFPKAQPVPGDHPGSDPDGPWAGVDWYTAARYCNWLSEQEGLPKEQWCYVPAEDGGYAEGMTVPADALRRAGYRLPTDAEWEYACRSGTITSRYYGDSPELLGFYARYLPNSDDHAWACGGLLPNDLGLFDMLGNQYEWVLDRYGATRPGRHGLLIDTSDHPEFVLDKAPRLLRGGAYFNRWPYVRSANRLWIIPSQQDVDYGFRPARTLE